MGICPAGPGPGRGTDRRHGCPPGMPYVSGCPGSHNSLSLGTQLWGGLPALHAVVWLTWLLGGPGHGSAVVAVRFASVRDTDVLKPQSAETPRARGVCPVVTLSPCRLSLLPPFLASGKQRGCVLWGWRCCGPGLWPDIGSYICSQSREAALWNVTAGLRHVLSLNLCSGSFRVPPGAASYLFG